VGIPTIVAGEAWIKGKGLTVDPISRQDYFAQLDKIPYPSRMEQSQIARAHRYAFHFFFRRMIPVSFLKRGNGFSPIEIDLQTLDQLSPGHDAGLDLICRGIMDGVPFVFPAEDQFSR
jgi:hypothetical protein